MSAVRAAVVIPVHNEERLLARALDAALRAVDTAREEGVAVSAIVVLDACTDRSAEIAARYPVTTIVTEARRPGTARRIGTERALRDLGALDGSGAAAIWLAHTDADSAVPDRWLTHQIELMRAGADLVVGTVRPDFDDLAPAHIALWRATHVRGRPNGHVHGANLGIRGSAYLSAGGFRDLPEHEDVELVAALRERGARIVPSDVGEVLTSGRLVGRTAGGYAGHLRRQVAQLAADGVA